MEEMTVKNKRLKVSPRGLVTLPVAARKALGMIRGEGTRVGVSIKDGAVVVTSRLSEKEKTWRVSKCGNFLLGGKPRDLLSAGVGRHYWLKLSDKAREVILVPFD
jgi:bifunctional DNA-binding transcriptional regulator/antitoxin component of YhaV-PrlF toxin-antitoxin module